MAVLARKADDLPVVRPLIGRAAPGPVLDLAGGFGRLALVAARAGSPVLVIDSSAPLLRHGERLARESEPATVATRITWRSGDIGTPLGLRPEHRLALLAYLAINEIGSDDGAAGVFRNARAGLAPGGRLYLEALPEPPYPRPGVWEDLEAVDAAGQTWAVATRVEPAGRHRHELQLRYTGTRTGEMVLQRVARRVWTERELDGFAAGAGLRPISAMGDGRFRVYGRE